MQQLCRCYQCFVQLDSAHSSTPWRPEMSMHYLWNHQLLYAGAGVFDGYSFICHQLSKRQDPVTIYALEGVTRALMRPFPFTLFAHTFRWISGMDSPTSSLSHFLLQCEEIFKSRTNIVHNSSARIQARDPMLGSSKAMWTSIRKLNSHLGLVFDGGAHVENEDRVVTGAAITLESRGTERAKRWGWGGELQPAM